MATKTANLVAELVKAGFYRKKGGKGSHRKFEHAESGITATICRKDGDDAPPYLIKEVRAKIRKAKSKGV